MVRFLKIRIEGFGCYGKPKSFNLDSHGLVVINGRNGSGKSTIFSALTWALYGKSLKAKSEVETWEFHRPKDWAGTMVQVSFNHKGHTYQVIRCKNYKKKVLDAYGKNRLIILKDGENIQAGVKDKRDLQKVLENILGYSFNLFTNTVVFPQKAKRFIEESGVDKKALLEEVFSLDWIAQANEIAKEERSSLRSKVLISEGKVNTEKNSIENDEQFLFLLQENKRAFEEENKVKLDELYKERKGYESFVEVGDAYPLIIQEQELVDKLEGDKGNPDYINLDNNNRDLSKIFSQISNAEVRFGEIKTELKHHSSKDHTCPTCGQDIDKDIHKRLVDELTLEKNTLLKSLMDLKSMQEAKTRVVENGKALKAKISENEKQLQAIQKEISEIQLLEEKERSKKEILTRIDKDIESVKKSKFKDISPQIQEKLEGKKETLKALEKAHKKLQDELRILEWVIQHPLSNSGLKSYIISNLIFKLNEQLRYYEKFTNFGIQLMIDEDLSRKDLRTIITRNNYPVLFEDLSGGESQLVNISISFALMDLMALTNSTNLIIFDEVFESLDIGNVEIVSELLQDKARNRSLFVITHRTDFSPRNVSIIKLDNDKD